MTPLKINAKAGTEYSTSAPAEERIIGRAKTCGVITEQNETHMLTVAAAIVALDGTSLCAAVAEAIQYETEGIGPRSVEEWAALPLVPVPALEKKMRNYREVRDAGFNNAMVNRCRAILATMEAK